MQNKRFIRKKLKVNNKVLDCISSSNVMTDKEKIKFMAFVGYMTETEQNELTKII